MALPESEASQLTPPMTDYLAPLNDEHRQAVGSCDGPLLVLAGAGTGKKGHEIHQGEHEDADVLVDASYQRSNGLTYAVMTGRRAGRLSPRVLTEMTGSVAGHDGAGVKSQALAPDFTEE
jgi:hypothetical protein